MTSTTRTLESQLLETTAGRSVFDALVQANIDVNTVSLDLVKEMLLEECRYLSQHAHLLQPMTGVVC